MNFLKEIEDHLQSFESSAKNELSKFVAYVKSKYSEPAAAVVAPAAPIAPNGELTIGQPAVAEVAPAAEVTPVEVETAPEAVEEKAADATLEQPTE
jgi:hypothetical protein